MFRDKKLLEQLFLLEVLVERVILKDKKCSKGCTCKHTASHNERLPLRVRVKFINYPCFEISQEEFGVDPDKLENVRNIGNFRSGKSCMFPMAPMDLIRAIQIYPLAITVFQRARESGPAEVLGVGRSPLSQTMSDSVRRSTECKEELPISTNMTGTFPLTDKNGNDVGRIKIFVRLTCFGQSIVTQFQLVGPDDYFLFKNSRADTAFQCRKCVDPVEPECFYKDIVPVPPFVCASQEDFLEVAREYQYQMTPRDLAVACECDIYKGKGVKIAPPHPPPPSAPIENITEEGKEVEEIIPIPKEPPRQCFPELVQTNPQVRYDTTGALSPAFEGAKPTFVSNPSVRYDTTGALSPAHADTAFNRDYPPNPPIRYDTSSKLTAAFEGAPPVRDVIVPHPPVRHDTTGALSPVHLHPAVRYDTTSALSPAYIEQYTEQLPIESLPEPEGVLMWNTEEEEETYEPEEVCPVTPPAVEVGKKDKRTPSEHSTLSYNDYPDYEAILSSHKAGKKKKKRKKKRNKTVCVCPPVDTYPTVRRGHKHCVEYEMLVPKRMGWLWNVSTFGHEFQQGWRPGAVMRNVSHMLRIQGTGSGILPEKSVKTRPTTQTTESERHSMPVVIMETQPPTLVLHRRHGKYSVFMKPLKKEGVSEEEPMKLHIPNSDGSKGSSTSQSSSKLKSGSESSSSSNLDIEFLAPGAFEPKPNWPVLKNREVQVYASDPILPKASKTPLSKKGRKKKASTSKESKELHIPPPEEPKPPPPPPPPPTKSLKVPKPPHPPQPVKKPADDILKTARKGMGIIEKQLSAVKK